MPQLIGIGILFLLAFLALAAYFIPKFYRRCPSNKILVVYGKVGKQRSVRCYHGGGAIIWPLIQDSDYMDLTPKTIHIPLKGALSLQNIRINVPSTFTVAIGTRLEIMNNAAIRLLGLDLKEIELMAAEIIVGQLRVTVASLTIEEINQDRERFLEAIRNNIEPELQKIGLTLINVNITDITDESGYIDSIGRKAVATALNQAKVDVAQQEKRGDIGKAQSEKERRIQVANYQAEAIKGENSAKAEVANANAELSEKEAYADQKSRVAKEMSEVEVQKAKLEAENKRLQVTEVVPEEIAKRKVELQAEAESQKRVVEAKAEAEALIALRQAEAEGLHNVLDAKAKGFKLLVEACGKNVGETSTMLLIEKLEEIVKLQTEAIQNLKIDKITVWDSGSQPHGKGTATSDFLRNMVKSVPALHDVADMAGVELPPYLGKIKTKVSSSDLGND